MGRLGEIAARWFLRSRGAVILGHNLSVGRGELDVTVSLGGRTIAVEVKTGRIDSVGEPIHRFTAAKRRQVRSLALESGIARVDYVGVEIGPTGALVRWLPNIG